MSIGVMNEAIYVGMLLSRIRMINNGLSPASASGPEAEQSETYRALAAFAGARGAVGRCLEIGSGFGHGLPIIAEVGSWRVEGVEGSRIAAAVSRLRGRRAVFADITRLPYAGDSFDHVLGVECVVCLDNPSAGMKEIARVLRPGGVLSIAEFRKAKPRGAERRLTSLAADAGLKLVDFQDVTDRARASVLAKAKARAGHVALIPPPFRRWARELSAVEGSRRHAEWLAGRRCYYLAQLEKPDPACA